MGTTSCARFDLGIWKQWIGSIRTERLERVNFVLLREEHSDNPQIVDEAHKRLGDELHRLFSMLHLRQGIECHGADLLCGSSIQEVPSIRQMSELPTFYNSKGYQRAEITLDWLEQAISLRRGVVALEADADASKSYRIIRGLNVLFDGLKETGQDRLHQFVRSLEALIVAPATGSTKKHFVHRCQTFAVASEATRLLLQEAFDMRSDTEHLNDWNKAVQAYAPDEQEDVCWQRTRQIESLACYAYARVLRDAAIRPHFRNSRLL